MAFLADARSDDKRARSKDLSRNVSWRSFNSCNSCRDATNDPKQKPSMRKWGGRGGVERGMAWGGKGRGGRGRGEGEREGGGRDKGVVVVAVVVVVVVY